MSKLKPTFPINKDPNWKYRPSFATNVKKTFERVRELEPLVPPKTVHQTLVVDEVQDAHNPSNVRNLRFARRAS